MYTDWNRLHASNIKIQAYIRQKMQFLGAQKIKLPIFSNQDLLNIYPGPDHLLV